MEKEMAAHSSILVWKTPPKAKPDRLESMRSQDSVATWRLNKENYK